ncbi:alanine--tRNA ligase [Aquipuribacter sp. MA13-6]|uniref:alanine--tRNA ligase n=1 Tax=unclassified Aquipuribacter TaxID=2635084 RepID=UPI003EE9673A
METAEIRRRWLSFFADRGHTVVPSASLVSPDPSLLFTVAGMVPFIPYLTGRETPPYTRATSVQKCVRTLDIEEVGRTTRHGTFFQMNGNFSFGDYFKADAIRFAWDLLTTSQDDGGYGFDPELLWATVYEEDDEAYGLWQEVAGLPPERIQRRGRTDNYWSTGQPGPAGPCSEIYVDRGPAYGVDGGPVADEDRYLEVWNLVFMQYEIDQVRSKEEFRVLGELPSKNIDTGMGLERVALLLQGVENMYEIDEIRPVLDRAAALAGVTYGAGTVGGHDVTDGSPEQTAAHETDVRLRVVADHVRSALMLIGDGVRPGNEGAGYVLRRLVRRAVRAMRLLGVQTPVLPELLPVSMERMSRSYPELRSDFGRISTIAYAEEEAFRRTLDSGTARFTAAADGTRAQGRRSVSAEEAFALHDTYGFPIDLTLEMAAEQGLAVDADGFRRLMGEQRERARADARAKKTGGVDTSVYRSVADAAGGPVTFTGYETTTGDATVVGLLVDGASVPAAAEGADVELVLDRTPFYAEGGGQLPDAGTVRTSSGASVDVVDVQSPITGLVVHRGRVTDGEVVVGDVVRAEVDLERRRSISRAHTATHMVHKAIREALGETATQAGSENAPGRFRFDFSSSGPVPPTVLRDVEQRVNTLLADDLEVSAEIMTQEQARAAGAMALFGEKYGDAVRVVSVGDWARELCGGTHVERSGQLGVVTLLGEASIGAGVRRVEALVGVDAYAHLAREHVLLASVTDALKVRPDEVPERVEQIVTRLREAEKELQRLQGEKVLQAAPSLVAAAEDLAGTRFVAAHVGEVGGDDVRSLVLDVRQRLGATSAVVALTAVAKGRPLVVVATNEAAREAGVAAGALVKVAAGVLGGGGGGKPDLAQGGGTDPAAVEQALAAVRREVSGTVGA